MTGWRVAAGVAVLAAVIGVMAVLVHHDTAAASSGAEVTVRSLVAGYGYLAGFALIYIEESGVPLFVPGDAFLLYVGHRLPESAVVILAAGIGFTLAVTFGATNLYLLARRYGRDLLEHRFARFLHLTPGRLASAERWFRTAGPWALIFGRHIFGLRVPLTVAAGILNLPYPVFAVSVAVSSAAWAALFLILGAVYGDGLVHSMRTRPVLYAGVVITVLVLAGVVIAARQLLARRRYRGR